MSNFSENDSFYTSDPDVLLMLEFQNGNRASFENLMRKYYKRVFNFVYRLIGNRASAEDLSQEVFLRIYKSAAKYQSQAKFQTWLYTIAKNLALNELRRKKRPIISLEVGVNSKNGDVMTRQIADEKAENPSEHLKREEQAQAVREAIVDLSENQRMVVVLYRYDRMTYEEIAETLKMSVSAIKSLLSRARESLRKSLDKFVNE